MKASLKRFFVDKDGLPSCSGMVLTLVILIIATAGVTETIIITLRSRNCAYASQQYHRSTHYDWLAGCYINIGGQNIKLDQYRAFQGVR